MSYIRTKEIRQKQSRSIKKAVANGARLGRSKEPRITKTCVICDTEYEVIKSRKDSKYCSRKCYMKSKKGKAWYSGPPIDKSYMKTEEYRNKLRKPDTPEYKRYANRVHRLSSWVYEEHKYTINPENHPRTLAGVDGGYHLDHVKPIYECFKEGLKPEEAATVENLRMLPWKENIQRNRRVRQRSSK